jgi:hypothetical protein
VEQKLEYVLALMNSKLFQWRFKLTSTNNKVGTNEIESMPFAKIDFSNTIVKEQHDQLVNQVNQMIQGKKQLATAMTDSDKNFLQNKCSSLDRQIDILVYKLYDLTEEEIRVVETS